MLAILIPLLLIAAAAAASYYLLRIRLPRMAGELGTQYLAGMKWRDYIHLVIEALHRRGFERGADCDEDGDGNYILERAGDRRLLSSKHGTSYVIGSSAIAEFANTMRRHGVQSGWLVTSGSFAPEAATLARAQRVELLDGPTLWPEIAPLLPAEARAGIDAAPRSKVRTQLIAVWAAALLLAAAAFVLLREDAPATPAPAAASAPATRTAAPRTPAGPQPTATPADAAAASAEVPTDPEALARRRDDLANAVSTLPFVDRALWPIPSTLVLYLSAPAPADAKETLCPLVERYPELATSRIQLQPLPDSDQTVRFMQCRMY